MPPGDAAAEDWPWRRPGRLRYAARRVRNFARPPVVVSPPPPGIVCERDTPVVMRDGIVLRANICLLLGEGPFPVLMSAHPYGKDKLPSRKGRRSVVSFQYRLMNQTGLIEHSTLTGWEAPDPAWWAGQGYAVVNADSRGAGTSEGTGALLSDQEALDYCDLIGWAASRPWCSGAVGLLGVSYLAMSQYKVAALNPPGLKAICPWEGMTDPYRDLMCPGGVYEAGFASIWTRATKRVARLGDDMAAERRARPLRDEWWQSLCADLSKITVPMLVCASFSDNNLHSRGSFRAFQRPARTIVSPTRTEAASGRPFTAPGPSRLSWRFSTATCGVRRPTRDQGYGWRSGRAETASPLCEPSKTGRWPARSGNRCSSQLTVRCRLSRLSVRERRRFTLAAMRWRSATLSPRTPS